MKTIACSVPYGEAGLGQHMAQMIEEARANSTLARYYAACAKPEDPFGETVVVRAFLWIAQYTPIRFSPGWKCYLGNDLFDREAASRLKAPIEDFAGFGGQTLHCFQRARALGAQCLELVSATSHVNNVARQQARSQKQYPLEGGWLNETQRRQTLREYDLADVIQVASEYTYQTFLAEGISASRLRRLRLVTAPRFVPGSHRGKGDGFRVVCTGSLTVRKGIPTLVEAFTRLAAPNAQLTLVGGWASRGMRHYLQSWQQRDPRIHIAPGDPLPHLQQADAYVQPSFEDGWAYAPMEAMACGVPVIVTEHTGMKECVQEGINGYVVPVGDWKALLERLEHLQKHPFAVPMHSVPASLSEPALC